jgi:thymidylate synthase ThyX
MIKSGCSAEIARSVLPLCLQTELVMTANFREWLHFISLRGAKAAHPQIRPIAYQISNILNGYSSIFEKYDMSSYVDYFEI